MNEPNFNLIFRLPGAVLLPPTRITENLTSPFVELDAGNEVYIIAAITQIFSGMLTFTVIEALAGLLEHAVAIRPQVWVTDGSDSFVEITPADTFMIDGATEERIIVFGPIWNDPIARNGLKMIAFQVFDPMGLSVVKATVVRLKSDN